MFKLIVVLLVLILFEFTSAAALHFPGSPGEADQYLHNTWTTRDGLSDNKNLKSCLAPSLPSFSMKGIEETTIPIRFVMTRFIKWLKTKIRKSGNCISCQLGGFKIGRRPFVLIKQNAHFRPIFQKAHYKGKSISRKLSPGFFSFTINHYKPLKSDKRWHKVVTFWAPLLWMKNKKTWLK